MLILQPFSLKFDNNDSKQKVTLKQTITVTKISNSFIFLHVFTVFTLSECVAELKNYFRLNGHAQYARLETRYWSIVQETSRSFLLASHIIFRTTYIRTILQNPRTSLNKVLFPVGQYHGRFFSKQIFSVCFVAASKVTK